MNVLIADFQCHWSWPILDWSPALAHHHHHPLQLRLDDWHQIRQPMVQYRFDFHWLIACDMLLMVTEFRQRFPHWILRQNLIGHNRRCFRFVAYLLLDFYLQHSKLQCLQIGKSSTAATALEAGCATKATNSKPSTSEGVTGYYCSTATGDYWFH